MNYEKAISEVKKRHPDSVITGYWDLPDMWVFQFSEDGDTDEYAIKLHICINKKTGEVTYSSVIGITKLAIQFGIDPKPKQINV